MGLPEAWAYPGDTGPCLTQVAVTSPDPDLRIGFPDWPRACLLSVCLPDDLDSTCPPWSRPACPVLWSRALAGAAPALPALGLTVLGCLSHGEQQRLHGSLWCGGTLDTPRKAQEMDNKEALFFSQSA